MMLVGIEGTALAGKTTIATHLAMSMPQEVVIVPEFMYFLFPGGHLPSLLPSTHAEQLRAIRFFANIDAQRMSLAASQAAPDAILLIDRTVETLIAHMHASKKWEPAFIEECWAVAYSPSESSRLDITIHLEVDPTSVRKRAASEANRPRLFENAEYVEGFNEYFRSSRKAPWPCKSIDAGLPVPSVVDQCFRLISSSETHANLNARSKQ